MRTNTEQKVFPIYQPFGNKAIRDQLNFVFDSLDREYQYKIYDTINVLKKHKGDCLLHPNIHQTDSRKNISIEDALAYNMLCSDVEKGYIYMTYVEIPRYAMADNEIHQIEKWDIDGFKFKIHNKAIRDGVIKLTKDINLIQLTNNNTFEGLPEITISKDQPIPLEVGTNSVLKMNAYLGGTARIVARIPYREKVHSKFDKCYMAIFASTKPSASILLGFFLSQLIGWIKEL